MINLKSFLELFEDLDNKDSSLDPISDYTIDQVRQLDSYKELVNKYGWKDVTTNTIGKNKGLVFQHDLFPETKYKIEKSGYIRGSSDYYGWGSSASKKKTSWPQRVSPIQDIGNPFAKPIKELSDYDIKFEYLKKYLIKKVILMLGLNKIKGVSQNTDVSKLGIYIDELIENDPSFAKKPGVSTLRNLGIYIPSEFSEDMLKAAGYGLF